MFDTVVVGARCAGAPLAMLLARAGQRVALLDRAVFPSDTLSTHFLWPRGVACLAEWGLLDGLRAHGCRPIREITFDIGAVQLRGSGGPVNGVDESYCPRRTVLDALLVEAAAGAGAEVVERFSVDEIAWSGGRAVGITGHHRGSSRTATFGARLVVGADGLRSTVAARVGAGRYQFVEPLTCIYYGYWSSLADQPATFYARPGQLILTWPTNDGLTCVYVAWPAAEFGRIRANPRRAFQAALRRVPDLAERLAAGRQETSLRGTRALPNFYRTSSGPGWALVGDAGHHKDPCTGMGMTDAFLSAKLLAGCLTGDSVVRRDVEDAISDYQQQRDAATAGSYQLTLKTARLAAPSPALAALYRTASDEPATAKRVFDVLGGIRPIADLYERDKRRIYPAGADSACESSSPTTPTTAEATGDRRRLVTTPAVAARSP